MPELSIILPSLRPERLPEVLAAFAGTQAGVDYEIVVVSPFPVTGNRVVHLLEKERRGPTAANVAGFSHARGNLIAWVSDDVFPTPGCLQEMIRFVRSQPKPFLGAFTLVDRDGRVLDQGTLYGRLYAAYGCACRETFEMVGGFFDLGFAGSFVDGDLGLRTWKQGGRVAVARNARLMVDQVRDEVSSGNTGKYFEQDTALLFNRWHADFADAYDRIWHHVNLPLPPSSQPLRYWRYRVAHCRWLRRLRWLIKRRWQSASTPSLKLV